MRYDGEADNNNINNKPWYKQLLIVEPNDSNKYLTNNWFYKKKKQSFFGIIAKHLIALARSKSLHRRQAMYNKLYIQKLLYTFKYTLMPILMSTINKIILYFTK